MARCAELGSACIIAMLIIVNTSDLPQAISPNLNHNLVICVFERGSETKHERRKPL